MLRERLWPADGAREPRRVVVTGGEHPAGLALLRGVSRAHYRPVAAVHAPTALAARSRHASQVVAVPDPVSHAEAHAEALGRLAVAVSAQAVLPGTEASLVALARWRAAIPPDVAVGAPDLGDVLRATDKTAMQPLADAAGLATPPTTLLEEGSPVPDLPIVLKPCASVATHPSGRQEQLSVAVVHDEDGLQRSLQRMPGGRALAQPFVQGALRTVNGVAWKGTVLAWVHQRGVRTWPTDAGVFAYGSTIAPDRELEERCGALLRSLRWSGLFNLQFLEPARGPLLLIDLNPRAYHSLALAVAAGVNLPGMWCQALLGDPVDTAEAAVGVRFRSETEDARALWTLATTGQLALALHGLRPHRATAHAVLDGNDVGPGLALVGRALRGRQQHSAQVEQPA